MESSISPKRLFKNFKREISPSAPSSMEASCAKTPPVKGFAMAKDTAAAAAVKNDKRVTWFGVTAVAAKSRVIRRENLRLKIREMKPSFLGTSDFKRTLSACL